MRSVWRPFREAARAGKLRSRASSRSLLRPSRRALHGDRQSALGRPSGVINAAIAQMQATGGMKGINATFEAARKEAPSLRYYDYLHA